ncbi:helicase-related protein [Schleiferilactobacillus shenzhenensis]|uniref:ComFA n=1 Tax=Schleiferilactobacillus shenzhenensis LY-73 TaxID=1231336 RepID=U4TXW7_9LACO|nr:helicase-related protein [Schleiferilactobacillus shenzhenensis]ERL66187.1 hypothetical protein L248_1279 [Schleiferilactobacillus shenzhenensis LY-73]
MMEEKPLWPGEQAVRAAASPQPGVTRVAAIQRRGRWQVCARCGARWCTSQYVLPLGGTYCPECLGLGRVTSRDQLWRAAPPQFPQRSAAGLCAWQGTLTADQQRAAGAIQQAHAGGQPILVWAVTGAGKTEMTFPAVAAVLAAGGLVAYASPRIDVCNELFPRVRAAFPTTPCALRHGREEQAYGGEPLVVCTTHQLLRFYHAFSLIIVDEVDAFPMHNSRLLHAAVAQALLPGRAPVYLTATPDDQLRQAIRRRSLTVTYLPRRFHGAPLPVPRLHWCRAKTLTGGFQPLRDLIRRHRQARRPVMLFVPTVPLLTQLTAWLRQAFPGERVAGVNADDPDRLVKVQAFRDGQTSLLVTTTILERGVTIHHLQVVVWAADHHHFQANALVQVAGRAGRAAADPRGAVDFFYHRYTLAIAQARRDIIQMNRRGGFS